MKLLKKAQIGGMQGFILSIVTVAIVLAIGLIVLNELKSASTSDGTSTGTATAATNATGTIITKLAGVPTWIGIIIIVALAFIVLSFFMGKNQ
jgi:hypothetical protein